MKEAVVVSSVRTGLAKSYRGSFNQTRPDDLLSHVLDAAMKRVPKVEKGEVEDVIAGCGFPEGAAGHERGAHRVARCRFPGDHRRNDRQSLLLVGLAGDRDGGAGDLGGADVAIGAGVESITMGEGKMNMNDLLNMRVQELWPGVYMPMGQTGGGRRGALQDLARGPGQVRASQPAALRRGAEEGVHRRGDRPAQGEVGAQEQADGRSRDGRVGRWTRTSATVPTRRSKGLAKLPPAFKQDGWTVTAATRLSSPTAHPLPCLMSAEAASKRGIEPMGIFRGFAVAGCRPEEMGIGPVYAVPKLLKRHGLKIEDIDVVELNEAFASQVLYCMRQLGITDEQINPNGGSIAIGHPYGMTGSRLTGTLLRELKRRKGKYGIVTMCIGGGQGLAALFEAR
jgi:hypothetical protein